MIFLINEFQFHFNRAMTNKLTDGLSISLFSEVTTIARKTLGYSKDSQQVEVEVDISRRS